MKDKNYEGLSAIVGEEFVKTDEPMSEHTTIQIGGPADYFVQPADTKEAVEVVRYCINNDLPYFLVGNGSNLVVRDKGFRGVIINTSRMNLVESVGTKITAECGANLRDVSELALALCLGGYEFAHDIPGTVGGGVRMNAGAYDGSHEEVVESVTVVDKEGNVKTLTNEECDFVYHGSCIEDKGYTVLSAVLNLKPEEDVATIEGQINSNRIAREDTQPPLNDYPSAGSVFRRPKMENGETFFVGTHLAKLNPEDKYVGQAKLNKKHHGFIYNDGHATSQEFEALVAKLQRRAKEEWDVDLEPEVIIMGEKG